MPSGDYVAIALVSVGMGGLVFGLIEAQTYGWIHQSDGSLSPIPLVLGAAVLSVIALIWHEGRRAASGRPVLIDLTLFRIPTFSAGTVAALIVALGEFGLLFTLPLLLQGALGYDALGTGWIIVFLAAGTFLSSGILPALTKRLSQRTIVQIGLGLEAVAVAGVALSFSTDVSSWALKAWLFLYGFGVGFATAQLTSLLLSDVPVEESGQASGLQSTVRQLGSALGVAALGGLLLHQLASRTRSELESLGLPTEAVDKVTSAVSDSAGVAIAGLQQTPGQEAVAAAATDAMIAASRVTTLSAAAFLLIGLLATLRLPSDAGHSRD